MADELKVKMDLLVSEFEKRNSHRVVNRSYEDVHSIESSEDLSAGVITFIFQNESDYETTFTQKAYNGKQKILMIARVYLEQDACGQDIEDEEFKIIEEIKTFIRATDLPNELGDLKVTQTQTSSQMEAPLAWVIADLEMTD